MMRRIKGKWWIILSLLVCLVLAGQVQAQGGWGHFVQQVVKSWHRTTQVVSSWFQPNPENAEDPSQMQAPAVSVVVHPSQPVQQPTSPTVSKSASDSVFQQWFESVQTIPQQSAQMEQPPVTAATPPQQTEPASAPEAPTLEQWLEFLNPPVPTHWDEDWLTQPLSEFEDTYSWDVEGLQDRLMQEIQRESATVQQSWQIVEELNSIEDPVYSDANE